MKRVWCHVWLRAGTFLPEQGTRIGACVSCSWCCVDIINCVLFVFLSLVLFAGAGYLPYSSLHSNLELLYQLIFLWDREGFQPHI